MSTKILSGLLIVMCCIALVFCLLAYFDVITPRIPLVADFTLQEVTTDNYSKFLAVNKEKMTSDLYAYIREQSVLNASDGLSLLDKKLANSYYGEALINKNNSGVFIFDIEDSDLKLIITCESEDGKMTKYNQSTYYLSKSSYN